MKRSALTSAALVAAIAMSAAMPHPSYALELNDINPEAWRTAKRTNKANKKAAKRQKQRGRK